MRSAIAAAALLLPWSSLAAAPTVHTACGALSGASTLLPYTLEPALRYSNIPYAAPPTGPLRFRPPQPPQCPWAGVRDGTLPTPPCVQTSGLGSEDCLYLSVAAPANRTSASALLPVTVYFHGGNLIDGAPPTAGLDVLAVRTPGQMIAVGVPYRLNTLGFLATADLAAEEGWVGNQGIADAIAALQWVQANIAAFGGDRTRVTVAGQSSGGTLIFALFACPSAAGLFTGALSMSGSPNITQSAAAKQAQDARIVEGLGCAAPPSPRERVACLRALSAPALARATAGTSPSWGTPGIFGWQLPAGIPAPPAGQGFAGIVHVDGALLTLPFHEALAAGTVPAALIISNMEAEGGGGGDAIGALNASYAQWQGLLAASFSAWGARAGAAAAAAIDAAYRAEGQLSPDLAYNAISSDYGLSCAARDLAARVQAANASRAPVYVLYNAWQKGAWKPSGAGQWPNRAWQQCPGGRAGRGPLAHDRAHASRTPSPPFYTSLPPPPLRPSCLDGLDFAAMTWQWGPSYLPLASDFEGGALMQRLLADFAQGRGVMPASWGWEPATPGRPLQTMVLARETGWPGGGSRAIQGFKASQCAVLQAHLAPAQSYWWCD